MSVGTKIKGTMVLLALGAAAVLIVPKVTTTEQRGGKEEEFKLGAYCQHVPHGVDIAWLAGSDGDHVPPAKGPCFERYDGKSYDWTRIVKYRRGTGGIAITIVPTNKIDRAAVVECAIMRLVNGQIVEVMFHNRGGVEGGAPCGFDLP